MGNDSDSGSRRACGLEACIKAVGISAVDALKILDGAAQYDTSGGLLSLAEVCGGAVFQAVEYQGRRVGAYALQRSQHDGGAVLWITACAANVPGVDLTPHILSVIEQQAQQVDADQVAITTARRGLIKKMLALGYEISGITLRKRIT